MTPVCAFAESSPQSSLGLLIALLSSLGPLLEVLLKILLLEDLISNVNKRVFPLP